MKNDKSSFWDWNIIDANENEKEIKENCQINLNEKQINFCFKKNFEKFGENTIKIILKNNLTYINFMFYNCYYLTSLDLSNFNTNNVKDMSFLFNKCTHLTSLNLSNFNTKNVNNMSYMFSSCSSLTSLNLSNFNTYNVTNIEYIFADLHKNIFIQTNDF